MSFKGSVGLVTGASSGMGKIIAERMAKLGMQVAALDLNEKGLNYLSRNHNNIFPCVCDISSFENVSEVIKEIEEKLGQIDCAVNAAAIMPAEPILDSMPNETMRLMQINYGGTVNIAHAIIPNMLKKNSGQIVFFGSIAGQVLNTGLGTYSATKSAVNTYVEILQHELKESDIHIMLVEPNAVNTPLIDQAIGDRGPKNIKQSKKTGRLANPEDIVDAIEQGLKKKKEILFPNSEARILNLARRFFPNALWSIIERSNR